MLNKKITFILYLIFFTNFSCLCKRFDLNTSNTNNPLHKSKQIKNAIKLQSAFREIYKYANVSVVRIETQKNINQVNPLLNDPIFRQFFGIPENNNQSRNDVGLGTGFVIDSSGYIITNSHVVANADTIKIKFVNGTEYVADLVGYDKINDIALLKIKSEKPLPFLFLGNSDKIQVGDTILAIGNPFGLSSTFTSGVVSSITQKINEAFGASRIQIDAAINPGNSGGPLLNLYGEVVGVNQMIYSDNGGWVGIGFAIPINTVLSIIDRLKKGEKIKHGYIGISINENPAPIILMQLGLTNIQGLLVNEVEPRSPAAIAGIKQYDFIVSIDGKAAEDISILNTIIARKKIGESISVKLLRNRSQMNVSIKIAKEPVK